eukprot:gnl/TRDRNA2_/TRDRNA2_28739_c0_seq1.p2 gnl/TRDRNA2_/TRDRNA2_28739_c0~~gnl/TRDRNA2_/TRDRNA2_28739_c0_seq1.p2  ORF type:complete len:115 (-),score=24.05 gnl/TRDRNA2_/TRDRNA2_28739_c0_seq1:246-590(-)
MPLSSNLKSCLVIGGTVVLSQYAWPKLVLGLYEAKQKVLAIIDTEGMQMFLARCLLAVVLLIATTYADFGTRVPFEPDPAEQAVIGPRPPPGTVKDATDVTKAAEPTEKTKKTN